jgi:hypothetical protein
MAQLIEVNGEVVEFPDGMSDADIAKALQPQETAPITSGFKMGLKDPISGGAQLLPRGLAFLSSAGGLAPNPVSRFFGDEAKRVDEMVKGEEQAYQQSRKAQGESGFDWSRLGGNVVNPTNLIGGAALTKALPAMKPMSMAAGSGATAGALQPVYNTDKFGTEKTKQTVIGGLSGVGGSFVAQKAAGVLNPITTKAEQTMADLGVQLTPGQRLGGQAATIEQFAQNLPLVGKFIANAKERGIYNFNKGVINKALGRVGEKLPEDAIGRDAVQYADEVVSQRYADVLGKVQFTRDADFNKALSNVVKIPTDPRMRSLADTEIKSIVGARIPDKGGVVDGATYQAVESDLKKRAMAYMNSTTAAERDVGQALQEAANLLKKGLAKQNPEQASALRRINSAYGDIEVMRKASVATGADNGVFTPKQYNAAVKAGDFGRQKKRFSRGQARGQDISEAAVETMSPPANSTIEGRLALGIGGGYAALQSPTTMAAAAALTPILYSPGGLRAMEAMMRSRPEIAREVGKIVEQRATKEGSITGAAIIRAYNEATKTAEERNQP